MLAHWPEHPSVSLVTTDGFLFPNAELERRGLLERKGFPESYDRKALLRFVVDIKSGKDEVEAPIYSHVDYDVVPERKIVVQSPDIVIVEGLNRSEEHTSELQSLMRISYAVFCWKKKK